MSGFPGYIWEVYPWGHLYSKGDDARTLRSTKSTFFELVMYAMSLRRVSNTAKVWESVNGII